MPLETRRKMDSGLKIRTEGRQLEEEEEETIKEPVSPTGQYFNSSVLSVSIIAVLEAEVPIDHPRVAPLLRQVFLPINPRFSSIMVVDEKGEKLSKRVDVKLQDHIKMPIFPNGLSPKSYDAYFDDYLTKLSMEPLSQNKPLWELHIIMYPTGNATSTAVFKIHHALGDGYSLMAALLSCLKRADDPTLPITLPMRRKKPQPQRESTNIISRLTSAMSLVYNSLFDFGWSILKSTLVEDDKTPIRSGDNNLELYPVQVSTLTFSLDQFKQIKDKLGVTINDIISGLTFLGSRLYMQEKGINFGNSRTTSLVLLNTRNICDYKSIEDMLTVGTESPWGNHFAFLHISIPKSSKDDLANPLKFVFDAQKTIVSKRHSLAVYLTSQTLETMRKCIGPEATAKLVYGTMNNASLAITNMIGPAEKSSLCGHPIKGIYFMVAGVPLGLVITIVTYMQNVRIGVTVQKGFIDLEKFKSCLQRAFELISKAANEIS